MFIHSSKSNTDIVFVGVKRKRCCECAGCTSPDCGSCKFCLDMTKFGGPGKKKKPCYQWKWLKMQSQEANGTKTTTSKFKSTRTPLRGIQNRNHDKNKN